MAKKLRHREGEQKSFFGIWKALVTQINFNNKTNLNSLIMKKKFLFKILLFLSLKVFSQNTDIRPTSINYPILNTNAILALTPSDGLRAGTTVYNSELQTLVIYDGCEWAIINKDYTTNQNPIQELTSPISQNNSQFGSAIEAKGKILVIGASHTDIGANIDQGAAYVYRKLGCFWQYYGTLANGAPSAGEHFGKSVDINNSSISNRLIIAIAGDQHINTYSIDIDNNGDPISPINVEQTIPNTYSRPILYVKVGNQNLSDEIIITYGEKFSPSFTTTNTWSDCNSTNANTSKISVFSRVSNSGSAYSLFANTPTNNMFSVGLSIPHVSVGRRLIYAEASCNYWSIANTSPVINKVNYNPSPAGYVFIPQTNSLPNSSIIPTLDLDYNGTYSQLAIGDLYGRNKQIKILTISRLGQIDKEESIKEPNVWECLGLTPTSCTNGTAIDADYYASTLSISNNMLIVGAPNSFLNFTLGQGWKGNGVIYIYKRSGAWGLHKIIKGQTDEGIGAAVASTDKNYFYSSIIKNSYQGSVYVGEW
jgi:hypothetical protein